MAKLKSSVLNLIVQFICLGTVVAFGVWHNWSIPIIIATAVLSFVTYCSIVVVFMDIDNLRMVKRIQETILISRIIELEEELKEAKNA